MTFSKWQIEIVGAHAFMSVHSIKSIVVNTDPVMSAYFDGWNRNGLGRQDYDMITDEEESDE